MRSTASRGYATPAQFAQLPVVPARTASTAAGSAALGGTAAGAGAAQGAVRDVTAASTGPTVAKKVVKLVSTVLSMVRPASGFSSHGTYMARLRDRPRRRKPIC